MAQEACPGIPEPLRRMKRDAKHKPQVGGGWQPSFPDGCVRNSVTVSSARQLPVRAALRQNANACAFTLHRFYNSYYTRPGKKCQSAFCISFTPRATRLLWIFPAPRQREGDRGVIRNLFGAKVSTARPPSSGAYAPPSPSKGKATTADCCVKWFHSPISPSSGTGVPPSPPRGRLLSAVRIFSVLLLNLTNKLALSLYLTEQPW